MAAPFSVGSIGTSSPSFLLPVDGSTLWHGRLQGPLDGCFVSLLGFHGAFLALGGLFGLLALGRGSCQSRTEIYYIVEEEKVSIIVPARNWQFKCLGLGSRTNSVVTE